MRVSRRRLQRSLAVLAAAVAVHHVALFASQRRLIFPGAWMPLAERATPPDVERIQIDAAGGTVHALLRPAVGAAPAAPAPLVLYAHGNAELATDFPWSVDPYHRAGFHVLVLEYRGFGGCAGVPAEAGIVEDAGRLRDLVASRPDVDGSRTVYHGRSLGGAVAASLARERPPRGLVLESAFSSIASMARAYLAPDYLLRDPFDTAQALREEYAGPTLIVHGDADTIVPVAEARANRDAAVGRAELIVRPGAGHLESWLTLDPDALVEFARSVTRGAERPSATLRR